MNTVKNFFNNPDVRTIGAIALGYTAIVVTAYTAVRLVDCAFSALQSK